MPNLRAELPADLAEELEASLAGMSIDQLIESEPKTSTTAEQLEPDSRVRGKVIHVHRDSVFVDLGGPNQGVLPLRQFVEPPALGIVVEAIVVRFNAEEGLFELTVPGGAVDGRAIGRRWPEGMVGRSEHHRPQQRRAGMRRQQTARLHSDEPDRSLSRRAAGAIRRAEAGLPGARKSMPIAASWCSAAAR